MGSSTAPGKPVLSVGRQDGEDAVFKSTVKKTPHPFLMRFAFVGVNPDAYKATGQFDEIFLREQTVLRSGVTRSKDARDAVALRRRRHEHDRAIAAGRFRLRRLPGREPGDARLSEIQFGRAKIVGTGALSPGCH